MIKQAPTLPRILAMTVFALSCFAILLSLWLSFGGPTPLRAESYRVDVAFPEAVGLSKDVDVRASGITIGAVRDVRMEHRTGRTVATLALDSEFAPLASDARAILRRKTLLGETFVEIAPGSRSARPVPDGGRLDDARVGRTVELDEVLQTFDPRTRRSFRSWQQELSVALGRRGEDLNDALGQLPELTHTATGLLEVLDRHDRALRGLVRDTGAVYGALTRDERQLRNLVVNSQALFRQTAAERESLAEAIQIFPTFLEESRLTLNRLESFSRKARPLVRDLKPVARELAATLPPARRLAPPLKRFFLSFDRQIALSRESLPAVRELLEGIRPVFRSLGPFLQEFNPIFEWLELNQLLVADFLGYGASGLAATTPSANPGETGHYLRQLSATGVEGVAIHPRRLSTNRGNAYLPPVFTGKTTSDFKILPNFDCKPAGGETEPRPAPAGAVPGCFVGPRLRFQDELQGQFPHVRASDYRKGRR